MRGYTFSEQVRRSLAAARTAATRLGASSVATEHLLLGLLETEPRGLIAEVLNRFEVQPDELRVALEAHAKTANPSKTSSAELLYTPPAKEVLAEAMAEAREHQSTDLDPECVTVGTEHLFLGLMRESQGGAGALLRGRLLSLEAARGVLLRLRSPA